MSADLPPTAPAPVERPVMVQRWSDVVFVHWRYDPAVVQALLPRGVHVDTIDGNAWVGLVPFRMEGLGVPGWAPLPLVGSFPEVNVRTYVRAGGRRGVWFFSLDIDRALPAVVACAAYHLPYCVGDVLHVHAGGMIISSVERRWPHGATVRSHLAVEVGSRPADDDALARVLTSRWGLVSATRRGRLAHAPVDHRPWPLQQGQVRDLEDGLLAGAGLPAPQGDPHVVWSPGVDVRVGRPARRCDGRHSPTGQAGLAA